MLKHHHIEVVAETNHSIVWAFYSGGQPFDVTGRTYTMVIVDDPDTPALTVAFTESVSGHEVECIGDCSPLDHTQKYQYQLVEDGNAILTGTVEVLPRFA